MVAKSIMSCRASSRPQIGFTFRLQVARQEAQPLPCFHRRPAQDHLSNHLRPQQMHRRGHRQVCLPGACRPDAEAQVMVADDIEIQLLVRSLRPHLPAPDIHIQMVVPRRTGCRNELVADPVVIPARDGAFPTSPDQSDPTPAAGTGAHCGLQQPQAARGPPSLQRSVPALPPPRLGSRCAETLTPIASRRSFRFRSPRPSMVTRSGALRNLC